MFIEKEPERSGKDELAGGRGPVGRPRGSRHRREEILDAAELVFSRSAFEGTSLKSVALACGITQAVVTYYFGTKLNLMREVFDRSSQIVAREIRRALSEAVTQRSPLTPYDLSEAVLHSVETACLTRGEFAPWQLHARLCVERPTFLLHEINLAEEEWNALLVPPLQTALPCLSERELRWRAFLTRGVCFGFLSSFQESCRPGASAATERSRWNEAIQGLIPCLAGALQGQH